MEGLKLGIGQTQTHPIYSRVDVLDRRLILHGPDLTVHESLLLWKRLTVSKMSGERTPKT